MPRVLFLVGFLFLLGQTAQGQEKSGKSPLLQEGVLQKARPHLATIFQFTFQGPQLRLDRKGWGDAVKKPVNPQIGGIGFQAHPLEGIFRQIQSSAGPINSSGMSISNNDREIRFGGPNMTGRLHTSGAKVRMEFEEVGGAARLFDFNDDGQGGFRLMISHADGDMVLLHQSRSGNFTVTALQQGQAFGGQDASFVALYRKYRKEMDARVLPVLEQFNIRLIMSPDNPQVRKALAALLTRSPEMLEEGKKYLTELDNEKFPIREKATRMLNERYEVYKDLIQEKLQEQGISGETQKRLNKILTDHPDSQKVNQILAVLDLKNDPGFILTLLEGASGSDAEKIAQHLTSITGQKLGTNTADWRAWLKTQAK